MADLRELARRLDYELMGRVERALPLAPYTTYRIGGVADLALFPADSEDLALALSILAQEQVPCWIMGGGSNVLVSDLGVRGAVILTTALTQLEVRGAELIAGAGVESHQVALAAARAGLTGAEFLTCLPGSIGGASYMNARAYGGELSQVLRRATVVRAGGIEELVLSPEQFSYKRSPFQQREGTISEVTLALSRGDPARVRERMDFIERERRAKHEMDHPSCGCVLKNDYSLGVSAGQLVEQCGLKGFRVGDAQVSPHHANFVINLGQATARQVYDVIQHVQVTVAARTGHRLEREVQLVGEWGDLGGDGEAAPGARLSG